MKPTFKTKAPSHHTSTLGALVRELTADGKPVPTGIFNVFDKAEDAMTEEPPTMIQALDSVRQTLDDVHQAHVRELVALARAAILPYFSEHRLTYRVSTSIGTWYIENERGRAISDEALPAHVRAVLDFQVSRNPPYYICLGFCVEDIESTDWIEQQSSKKPSRKSSKKPSTTSKKSK